MCIKERFILRGEFCGSHGIHPEEGFGIPFFAFAIGPVVGVIEGSAYFYEGQFGDAAHPFVADAHAAAEFPERKWFLNLDAEFVGEDLSSRSSSSERQARSWSWISSAFKRAPG